MSKPSTSTAPEPDHDTDGDYIDEEPPSDDEDSELSDVENIANEIALPQRSETVALDPTYLPKTATPIDAFLLFVPRNVFEFICEESNKYNDYLELNPEHRRFKRKKKYKPITLLECQNLVGCLLRMSLTPLPAKRMYWEANVKVTDITRVMTRDRFQQLMSLLHFADLTQIVDRNDPGFDKYFRARPFIELLMKAFLRVFFPEDFQSNQSDRGLYPIQFLSQR